MCCVIFAGVVQSADIEAGIDVFKNNIGDVDDPKFLKIILVNARYLLVV